MSIPTSEYANYYSHYIELSANYKVIEGLELVLQDLIDYVNSLPECKYDFSYAEGKWTIKELLLHLIDTERIFQYRALRFARADDTTLPGFDENQYVLNSNAKCRTIESILCEFKATRYSSIELFKTFDSDVLLNIGCANNSNMSVRAIGKVIIGHQIHHMNVISNRYLD